MALFQNETATILIFKTSLKYKKDIKKIAPALNGDFRIKFWSVDIEDIDKILRIAAESIQAHEICELIETTGFYCQELQD